MVSKYSTSLGVNTLDLKHFGTYSANDSSYKTAAAAFCQNHKDVCQKKRVYVYTLVCEEEKERCMGRREGGSKESDGKGRKEGTT
jgi:hypothetical protein